MQPYEKKFITKEELIPVAEKMRADGVTLAMIHAFIDDEGNANVSYEFQKDPSIVSCTIVGESTLPSISAIYDLAAEWPEREIMELMPITFEGVDTGKRLFMPDSMLDGQGQILVTPMDKLKKMAGTGGDEA